MRFNTDPRVHFRSSQPPSPLQTLCYGNSDKYIPAHHNNTVFFCWNGMINHINSSWPDNVFYVSPWGDDVDAGIR